jgi:hypothetical protein
MVDPPTHLGEPGASAWGYVLIRSPDGKTTLRPACRYSEKRLGSATGIVDPEAVGAPRPPDDLVPRDIPLGRRHCHRASQVKEVRRPGQYGTLVLHPEDDLVALLDAERIAAGLGHGHLPF